MKIRKTYNRINPELLYGEVKDFILKHGATLVESKLETYTMPDESATFTTKATLTFHAREDSGKGKECLRAHIVGSVRDETKLMLDIDEKLFSQEKIAAFQEDLSFIFGSYEVKS